jgi:hypothetical protein
MAGIDRLTCLVECAYQVLTRGTISRNEEAAQLLAGASASKNPQSRILSQQLPEAKK